MVAGGIFTGAASGQTVVTDDDCTFSITASNKDKNWWVLSVSCEYTMWNFIDMQGWGLRGSAPISTPPECQRYADQTFADGARLQTHACGPPGLVDEGDGRRYLAGAAEVKVNPKAYVPQGYSPRLLDVKLYVANQTGGGGLVAEVVLRVPKMWVEPAPSPPPTESPEPTPSESVPTATPSPSPTGPVLVLTKTVDPKKVPHVRAEDDFLGNKVVWTITVKNVGTAAYEGSLDVIDRLPDVWNLYPTTARVQGPAGFTPSSGVFYSPTMPMNVYPGYELGAPAFVGTPRGGGQCSLLYLAGRTKTLIGFEGSSVTNVDDWAGLLPGEILHSKRAEKLHGPALVECYGSGRIEPGEEVVITVEAQRRSGDRTADVKSNIATAIWLGGSTVVNTVVELEGINSVLDDIDPIVTPAGAPVQPMAAGSGDAFYGTDVADELTGTSRSDVIMGHYGDDLLRGLGGIDVVSGDAGNDEIFGGQGRDGLNGGSGKDAIYGGDGNDELVGGPDKDRLIGGAGDDRINARDGERDVVVCGPGRDVAIVDKRDEVKGCEKVRRA